MQAVRQFKAVLKAGVGTVLVRDYAAGDLAERRLAASGAAKQLGAHFHVRGDGTRCLYFTEVRGTRGASRCQHSEITYSCLVATEGA
jgi:hypothetical protein